MAGRRSLSAALLARAPALGQRNFRRYFYGQVCSVAGTFVQAVALSWLVYRLTGSAALLGLTAFLSQSPQLLLGPLAGVIIDRFDRRRLLILLQCAFAAQALTLAGLVLSGYVEVWHILVLAALLGVLNSFDLPSRQSILLYLVEDRVTLGNAVALNAAVVHGGRLLAPPLAGLLLAAVPESVCFLINALSYLGPILAVRAIRVEIPRQKHLQTLSALREVGAFIRASIDARLALGAVALVNGTASAYIVLMPVFAKDVFAGDAQSLGLLLGAGGGGALMASVFLATRARARIVPPFLFGSGLLASAGLLHLYLAGAFGKWWLSLPAVAMIGAGIAATNISSNTLLQHLAPESLRGRVISIFGSLRFGFDALGGLLAGVVAAKFGILAATLLLGTLLFVACFLLRGHFLEPDRLA